MQLTALYLKVSERYIVFVEELPGANTQAETLAEARAISGKPSPWSSTPIANWLSNPCTMPTWRAPTSFGKR
jgi:hypothetical protein